MTEERFITHDFKLPNHNNELSKAEEIIEKQRKKYRDLEEQHLIDDKTFVVLYEEVVRILDYIGRLSMPAFAIEKQMEEKYVLQYPKSPELAKKLWLDHYESIHHPYNILKNRCFRMLEEMDDDYIRVNKKDPPNWKI